MTLIKGFLTYSLNRKSINSLLNGYEFEDYVQKKLEKMGFSTKDPKNSKLNLKDIKIKREDKTEACEIDLIAYNDSTIWVIECKDHGLWEIKPKIFWQKSQEQRKKKIKQNIRKKHVKRVEFVQKNYKKYFGFEKNFTVKGLFITRIKENMSKKYLNVDIIPEYELEEFFDKEN